MTYVAEFPATEEYLAAAFREMVSSEPRTLGEDGGYEFRIAKADFYRPANMGLSFIDANGKPTAFFQLNLIAPVQ